MNVKRWVAVFAVLSAVLTAFIWGNSLIKAEQADAIKLDVAVTVNPSLDLENRVEKDQFGLLVSKSAHLLEFGALGLCLAGLCINLGKWKQRRYFALPLLLVLAVGVMDEFLQTFSGRTSAVGDILIDFAGGLLGLGLAALGYWLVHRKKTV